MKGIASVLASQGRGEDSMLVHMTPKEVGALHGLAAIRGGGLSTNPITGLPEAGILGSILPMLAGAAMNYFVPGSGFLGSAGANAAAAGAGVGFLQKGSLQGALSGGIGGLGGGSLVSNFGLGAQAAVPRVGGEIASTLTPTESSLIAPSLANGFAPAAAVADTSLINPGFASLQSITPDAAAAAPTLNAAGTALGGLPSTAVAIPGASGIGLGAQAPALVPTAPTVGAISRGANDIWGKLTNIDTYFDPATSKITGPGYLALGAGAMGIGSMADKAAKAKAELERARGNPYLQGSDYQNAISYARQPNAARGWAAGGITGLYPNRIPENEVVPDPTAQQGNEPHVDPFTGQQQNSGGGGMAGGGIAGQPRYLKGAGDGMSDSIPAHIEGKQPAALADGEFVIPADVVGHLGNGSSEAGAKQLHAMMDRIRKARTGNPKQGKQINAQKFMPA